MMGTSMQDDRKKVIRVKMVPRVPQPALQPDAEDISLHMALHQTSAHLQMIEQAIMRGDVQSGWDWFKKAANVFKKGANKVKDDSQGVQHGHSTEVVTVNLPKEFMDDTHKLVGMFEKMLQFVEVLVKAGAGGDDSDQGQEKRLCERGLVGARYYI